MSDQWLGPAGDKSSVFFFYIPIVHWSRTIQYKNKITWLVYQAKTKHYLKNKIFFFMKNKNYYCDVLSSNSQKWLCPTGCVYMIMVKNMSEFYYYYWGKLHWKWEEEIKVKKIYYISYWLSLCYLSIGSRNFDWYFYC